MNIELYNYGLEITLKSIEEALENALRTSNKKEMARYLGEAYGLTKAISALVIETEDKEMEDTEEND